jgi:hypothetical protein
MARKKAQHHTTGPILYGIAAVALGLIAWQIARALPESISGPLRLLTILLAVLFSLTAVFIQYKRVYGPKGRLVHLHRLRKRKGETLTAFEKRRSMSSLWVLCRSFLLLILWPLLCWAAVILLGVWLAALSGKTVQFLMLFIAFGAALSLWTLVDQFIP